MKDGNLLSEDWREIPAGIELDRIVAERLGWTDFVLEEWYEEERDSNGFVEGYEAKPPDTDRRIIPKYSTSLAQAWELVCPAPDIILFNMTWTPLPPYRVAYLIVRTWLQWKDANK